MKGTFEAWEKIFRTKDFDVQESLHFITAEEIKKITGLEPRIMAKVDFSKDLPPVFARNGYFLLPTKNGTYAIVRGDGFHRLETGAEPKEFISKIDFPLTTAGRGQSEMQYLDHAYNTGALEELIDVGPLYQSIRGREYSKRFSFNVGDSRLDTESVQIEVDSGLEGKDSIVLVEAKVGKPDDFIIRQLFYPFRHFQLIAPEKKIVPIFFVYDLAEKKYTLWVYKFADPQDYNSIQLIETRAFKIATPNPIKIDQISPKGVVKYKDLVPQANDLNKIIELTFKVSEGFNNYQLIADYFKFNERQSSYYREAAEALGLVERNDGTYILTPIGHQFVSLETEQRNIFFLELLSDFHLVQKVFEELRNRGFVDKRKIEEIITKNSHLSGSTIPRRTDSLIAWFRWIAEHTGTVAEVENGLAWSG